MQSNYLKSLNNYLCRQQPTESALRCQHLLTKTNNNFCHLFFENKLASQMEAQTQVELVSLHLDGGQAWPHFNSSYIGGGSSRSERQREDH